jgi:hypothetical protein
MENFKMSTVSQADANLNKSNQFVVTATYEGKMDERREQRIHAAFKRCGVRLPVVEPLTPEQLANGAFPVFFSDIEWLSNEDNTQTELTIYIDGHEQATRLKSELRACGLLVHLQS